MKIYWIIVNGQPKGPFTPDEISELGVVTPGLRVWRKGLTQWVAITDVPELAHLLDGKVDISANPDATVETVEVEEVTAVEVGESARPAEPAQPQPYADGGDTAAPAGGSFSSWGNTSSSSASADTTVEPMPQTYLPWNVLATICCCIPAGIIGIIFSAKVSKKYNEGDMAGARKASEAAAWCLMIAIVLGLVSFPFQMFLI